MNTNGYGYFIAHGFKTHPNRSEWAYQKRLAKIPGFGSWYGDYMRSKSLDERNNNLLRVYGYDDASRTKYPWLTGTNNESGAISRGAMIVSRNISRLYDPDRTYKKTNYRPFGYN